MLKNRIPQVQKIPQFETKNPEIPHEKWSNTAIPQTPMSPSTQEDLVLPQPRVSCKEMLQTS